MMDVLEKKILGISPRYLGRYESLVKEVTQFGGGAESERYVTGRLFGNVYQFYMFCFFLGLKRDLKVELLDSDNAKPFWEMQNWQPTSLRDYMIACAIGQSEFDMAGVEHMEDVEISQEVKKLKRTIEAYANGGLKVIDKIYEEDPDQKQNDDFLLSLL